MNIRKFLGLSLCAIAPFFVASSGNAGIVIDDTVTGSVLNDFDALPAGAVPGFISQTGATYGEHFSGQILATGGGFDSLSGTPSAPLTLVANPVLADNIGILPFGTNVIYGDLAATIGEGALSVLIEGFVTDIFGFDIVGVDGGGVFTAQFFGADGALLGSITQGPANRFFGFRATDGDRIMGVSITNTDPAGIAYDNVTFNQIPKAVPEPATLALLGLGLLGLVSSRRKQ